MTKKLKITEQAGREMEGPPSEVTQMIRSAGRNKGGKERNEAKQKKKGYKG